jgi:ring-1,2-phenylacetyl-CoA epoxidase subunit PaaE
MFREELLRLKDRYLGRLALLFVMSREPQDIDVFHGRIDEAKTDALLDTWIDIGTVTTAFVCGPFEMTEAVTRSLERHGLAHSQIKTELFAAGPRVARAPREAPADDAGGTVAAYAIVDGRRHAFAIERGTESVLDAGLRQGIELPYSCKGGVCSTCRVKLIEGEVDMDVHYALEDYEIADGFILMCQSYPMTDTVGIDVDLHSHV